MSVFSIPVGNKFLLYAPLHSFAALVNQQAVAEVRRNLLAPLSPSRFIETIKMPDEVPPHARDGALDPLFLGIIPTRSCNLDCKYCDFAAPKHSSPVMDVALARDAINSYLVLKQSSGASKAEIQFFGGEPFYAEEVVRFSVEYATRRAAELGLQVHFEVTTNGMYRSDLSHWIAENFNAVVLSLDGPKDIQDQLRPARNGKSAFDRVFATAKMISQGSAELILRSCITKQTVNRMQEIAIWFCEQFNPSTVCFETMVPSELSAKAGLEPPDPWEFAQNFFLASEYLAEHNIMAVHATAETHTCRTSFCPLGKDALIVSPDGSIDACYLLQESWERRELDLHLGQMEGGNMNLPFSAIVRARNLNVESRSLCKNCFCRYHCAGGCYVNHDTSAFPGQYDALCIQTRILTIINLLKRLDQGDTLAEWLADRKLMEVSVLQPMDRLYSDDDLQ